MSRSHQRPDQSSSASTLEGPTPGRRALTDRAPAAPPIALEARPAPVEPAIDAGSIPAPAPIFGDLSSWSSVALGASSELPAQLRASSAGPAAAAAADPGPGDALPAQVQHTMGRSFGADLSDVRVHHDDSAAAMGAIAYTRGTDIHFSSGAYDPESASGRDLLGHELAHVVQQRAGVVAGTQTKGGLINADPELEAEADREGAKAARGERATVAGAAAGRQARPMRGGGHAIQGMWWIVKDLGQGVLEGILKEGGKEATKEGLKKAIGEAAPALMAALEVAMQSPELRAMLGKLSVLADAKAAALAVAKDHAGRIAGELAAWIRAKMPDLPEHLIPEMVRDLTARIEERLRQSYAARVMEAVVEVGGSMLNAGVTQHISNLVDNQLIKAAGSAVKSTVETAAAPVLDAAHATVETARQVQETIGDLELPLPGLKPVKKIGRKIGEGIYHAVRGTDEAAAHIDDTVLDPLTGAAARAVETGKDKAAEQIRTPGAALGVDPATVYKAVKTTREFATASTTDKQLNALASPAVDYGMGALGMMAAPALATMLPAAAVPLAPVMAAAGGVALGQRYVMPVVRQATEAAAPHLEAFGNTTIGTPVKKVAQSVHTTANMFNLGMSILTAPLPLVGGGWKGIEDARQSADNSVNALMGWESQAPARAPATARVAAREAELNHQIALATAALAAPSTAAAAKRERTELRTRLQTILSKRLRLVNEDIAHAEGLVTQGQRHAVHLDQLRAERAEISARLAAVTSAIAAEAPAIAAGPRMVRGFGGVMLPVYGRPLGLGRPLALNRFGFNPFLSPLSLAAMGVALPMPGLDAPPRVDAAPHTRDRERERAREQDAQPVVAGSSPVATTEPAAPHLELPSVPTHDPRDRALRQRLDALGSQPIAEPEDAHAQPPASDAQLAAMPEVPTHEPGAAAERDQALQDRFLALGPHNDDELLAELELEYRFRRLADRPQPQVSQAQLAQLPAVPTHPVVEDPLMARFRALGGAPTLAAPTGPVAPVTDEQLAQLPAVPTHPVAEDPLMARFRALGGAPTLAAPTGPVAPVTDDQLAQLPAVPTHPVAEDPLIARFRALGGAPTLAAPTGPVAPVTDEQLAQLPAVPTHPIGHAGLIEANGVPAAEATRVRKPVALTSS
jgi:hypothetical protein